MWNKQNGPFAASGHMVHAGGQAAQLPTGTSKTKRLHQDKFEFSLFCPSGQLVLQHVPCDC